MQNAKEIVRSLLGLPCDYRVQAQIISDEYFDYFVYPIEQFAIYAYSYDLDGVGMAMLDVSSSTSYLWPFELELGEPVDWGRYYLEQMQSVLGNDRCLYVIGNEVEIEYDRNRRNGKDCKSLQDLVHLYESGQLGQPST